MRNILLYSLLITVLASCEPVSKKAATYNDEIIDLLDTIIKADQWFINALNKDSAMTEDAYSKLASTVNYSGEKLKNLQPFEGNDSLKAAALIYTNAFKQIVEKEYYQMKKLMNTPQENISIEDDELYSNLKDSSEIKREKAFVDFEAAQLRFSTAFEFMIEADTTN